MSKKNTDKNKKRVSIGGQAVLEGVYMRGASSEAIAVRDQDGVIRLETKRRNNASKQLLYKIPIVRGVAAFIDSLFGGTKTLMRSAEVYGEGEPTKFEKWVAEKLKINVMTAVSVISVMLGLLIAVALFMFLPQVVRGGLEKWLNGGNSFGVWAKNFIEGGVKLLVFTLYILFVSLLKDIRRTFMYHGAEHKTITCFERGLDLTVENAAKCPRVHDRCGTTFIVFVLFISIIVMACVEALLGKSVQGVLRVLLKLALLPVVAGLSYELLKLLSKTKSPLVLPIKAPGFLLQLLTTREPSKDMLEVAITSFKAVYEMDNDESIPERKFELPKKRCEVLANVRERLKENGIDEDAEAEWIVSITLGIKRDEVNTENLVSVKNIEKINALVDERVTGRPLWYCIGDTDFYGYKIKTDERALIPRPETELLVENALKVVDETKSVLDLCTGSGAIAVAISKETGATVYASDISLDALKLAQENEALNRAKIKFVLSDMFESFDDEKFDVIVSNPPYIKSDDVKGLQKEIRDFEPVMALDGGEDGLHFYRIIAENAKNYLNEGGTLLLECGIGQAEEIKDLLTGFSRVEIIKDYENIDRIIKAVL
ncbi:MAG: peptide chain release factor N(5)-glutamine methyltransferase [Clostridia bacterium]|nr:peptide chain release factor N(5)-glutamine methyltransferase [Clostridia bacterium]